MISTVEPGYLHIIASDFDARPMTCVIPEGRSGYEPDLTRAVCQHMGLTPIWHDVPMSEFYTQLQTGRYDVIWFNQAITPERQQWVDFSRPYGLFDEAVLVRVDCTAQSPDDLVGLRVGGLADSTNIALAVGFAGVTPIAFPGSDQVLPDMLSALRSGDIDALIDDELVLIVPAEEDAALRLAFSLPTRVPFAVAVQKGNASLLAALNQAIAALIADGTMQQFWQTWIPWKPFPFTTEPSSVAVQPDRVL